MPRPAGFDIEVKEEIVPEGKQSFRPEGFELIPEDVVETRQSRLKIITDNPLIPAFAKFKILQDKASEAYSDFGRRAQKGLISDEEAIRQGNEAKNYWIEQAGQYGEDVHFTEHPFKYVAGEAVGLLPYMYSSAKRSLSYGLAGGMGFGTMAAMVGQVPPLTLVPEEFITVPVAFAAGFTTLGTYGIIDNILDREGGEGYLKMREMGISRETAQPLSYAAGLVIGIIEVAQFGVISKPFKKAFSKVLRSQVAKDGMVRALGRYVKSTGIQVGQEVLQNVASLTSETIAGVIDKKPDAIPTAAEWKMELLETLARSAAGLAVISIPGGVVDVKSTIAQQKLVKNAEDAVKLNNIIADLKEQQVGKEKKVIPSLEEKAAEHTEVPKELQPLYEEARKYKSAEEFVKAQTKDVFYHGTKAPIQKLSETNPSQYAKVSAIYGEGLYLTDNIDVAKSYSVRKGKGKEGKVLAGIVKDVKLLDLDAELPNNVKQHFKSLIKEYSDEMPKSWKGREVYDFLREAMAENEIYQSDAIEIFQDINNNLYKMGYQGLKHIGGRKTKSDFGEHNVVILFQNPFNLKLPNIKDIEAPLTKSQLTDIWNEANKRKSVKEGENLKELSAFFDKEGKKVSKAVSPEALKPDVMGISSLEKQITAMGERQEKVEIAQSVLSEIDVVRDYFKRRITPFKDKFMKEELSGMPSIYVKKEGGIKADEVIDELKNNFNIEVQSVDDLRDYLKNLEQTRKNLLTEIEKNKPGFVRQRETTILAGKIKAARQGIARGTIDTKKSVKAAQTELVDFINEADLELEDKAKFISALKNVQTKEELKKAIPKIENRIVMLKTAESKRVAVENIKKELKSTKPVKVGQRRVGKFDYESNKLFDEIIAFNKLNQDNAQLELDKLPEEVTTEVDLIKKRLLSLKANGAKASLEIHEQVLADIQKIKQLGKQAKDEADLMKRINRQEIVDSALASIEKIKADKKTLKTKIGNLYRNGATNMYSMYNSIGGKQFAEMLDPKLKESRRNAAIYEKTLHLTNEASVIYNEKNVMRLFEGISRLDYKITDVKKGITREISKLAIIDIYNAIKNEKTEQDYFEAYGESQVQSLMTKLTSQDEAFGDFLQETVQGYREILNKRNIETTGLDLGFVENYWPGTSKFQVSVIDDLRIQGETPSAMKEKAKTRVIPIPKDAWLKAIRHIAQAEHVDKVSREFEKLKRLFSDENVKDSIEKKFGEDVYSTIMSQIDNLSLHKHTEKLDLVSSIFQKAVNNWVVAKISFNPGVFVNQLNSVGNYAGNMNAAEWTAGFFKGISSPKETFDFVWNNAPFLKERFYQGYNEALKEAVAGAKFMSVNKANWTMFLTSFARSGDIAAVIYGGFPLIKSELAKHGSMEKAIDVFEIATLESQQSGLSSSLSQFQNSKNPFTRLFLAFKNTANQYFRKQVDAIISFQNKDISAKQLAKTTMIYSVIQPILYASTNHVVKAGFASLGRLIFTEGDEEDFGEQLEKLFDNIIIQLATSPVNAVPVLDDIVESAIRKFLLDEDVYKVFSAPLFDDLEKGFRALSKEEITGEDYMQAMISVLEPTTSIPIGTAVRYFNIFTGNQFKKSDDGLSPK